MAKDLPAVSPGECFIHINRQILHHPPTRIPLFNGHLLFIQRLGELAGRELHDRDAERPDPLDQREALRFQ